MSSLVENMQRSVLPQLGQSCDGSPLQSKPTYPTSVSMFHLLRSLSVQIFICLLIVVYTISTRLIYVTFNEEHYLAHNSSLSVGSQARILEEGRIQSSLQ